MKWRVDRLITINAIAYVNARTATEAIDKVKQHDKITAGSTLTCTTYSAQDESNNKRPK
jgi:hypothetical protein